MKGLASSDVCAADEVAEAAGERTADAAAPALDVLVGRTGLAAGLFGSVVVAVTTVAYRWLEVPFLYTSPRDATLHLALEMAAGAALWLVIWAMINAALRLERRLPAAARPSTRRVVLFATGAVAGLLVFYFVVRLSLRSAGVPPSLWLALLGVSGGVVSTAGATLLRLRLRVRRARPVGFLLLGAMLALHLFALEHYVRHYGNLQTIVLLCVTALAALGSGLAVGAVRLHGSVGRFAWGALATSLLWIAMLGTQPSYSTRRAVLVWGGVAKRAVLGVVWPVFDRDADGGPGMLWGMDPDDRRAAVTPRKGLAAWTPPAPQPLGPVPAQGPYRNLLWVTVDTVRRDSFERALAANPDVARVFAAFADHRNYASCSSRTIEAMSQLLGARRCDPRSVEGVRGHALLEQLRALGYRDRLVGLLDSGLTFKSSEILADDPRTVARAGELVRDAEPGTALFVHLRGGHAEYQAPGATERERYENQLRASLASVAKLVSRAPPERWAVVIIGDHGEAFGEHVSFGHATTLYEEVLRTPLLVRGPNVTPGPREERVSCDSVAWFALHAVGLFDQEPRALPFQYAALDIKPGELGHLQGDRLRSLRVGSRKVLWSSDLGLWELYDLDADPGELHSLAESRPGDLAPLRAKLEELSRDCPEP